MDLATLAQLAEKGGLLLYSVVLTLAVVALWRRNIALTDRNDALNDKMLEITLSMGRENRELITATNTTLTAATGAINATISRLERH